MIIIIDESLVHKELIVRNEDHPKKVQGKVGHYNVIRLLHWASSLHFIISKRKRCNAPPQSL